MAELKKGVDAAAVAFQLEEIYHNLFRMHSYIEAAYNVQDGVRPQLLQQADTILKISYLRVCSMLEDTRRLEPPGVRDEVSETPNEVR